MNRLLLASTARLTDRLAHVMRVISVIDDKPLKGQKEPCEFCEIPFTCTFQLHGTSVAQHGWQ